MAKHNILFVCLGNICRSAAAEAVMKKIVDDKGASADFNIDSAGILNYHQGEHADPRMISFASRRGYDVTTISRPVKTADFDRFDLVIGMDNTNVDDLYDRAATAEHTKKIHKMTEVCRNFTNDYVPDPYYGGADGFELVLDLLEDACEGLYETLKDGKL